MNEMMAREIAAQPETLRAVQPELARLADGLARPRGRVLAGGCGDSHFAPRALAEVTRRMGAPIGAHSAMELCAFVDLQSSDTIILSSISGGTKRTVEAARFARGKGAHVVAVTCNGASALAEAADETLVLPFTPLSRKTPHSLDYAVTLLALTEIARSFAGLPADATSATVAALGDRLAAAGHDAAPLSEAYVPGSRIVILGAGPDLGTAEYGAAKFHEADGLLAIAAETENFVHGMNFMLEADDTLIVLAGTDAGASRGRQVADAFAPLVHSSAVLEYADRSGRWENALTAVFGGTFLVQALCVRVADRLELTLEKPRAGRLNGDEHMHAQSAAMAH